MKQLIATIAITAIAITALFALVAGEAGADAPVQQGWWSTGSASTPVGATPHVAPDVPANGLLIEGGPSSPVAYAALVYSLGPGIEATTLTLRVADGSGTTPNTTLQLCPLDEPLLHAQQGGPMSDAPAYSCDRHATADQSDGAFRFDVAELVSARALAVAILPTTPTDRVVLSEPDGDSLAVQHVSGSTWSDATSAVERPVDQGSPVPLTPALSLPDAPVPNAGQTTLGAPHADGSPSSLMDLAAPPTSRSPARPLAVALVAGALGAGVAAWNRAGLSAIRGAGVRLSGQPDKRQVQVANVPGVHS